jgi:hypothetical protein
MHFEFNESDLENLLQSTVGEFEKDRKLCSKCDHFDSVKHAGIACAKCGGEMVSVKGWTVFNLLTRAKPTPTRGEMWLAKFVSDYLAIKSRNACGWKRIPGRVKG